MSAPIRRVLLATTLLLVGGSSAARSREPKVESWPLNATTELALVEDHRAPLVTVRIVFPAGTWSPWFRRSHAEEAFAAQMYDPAGTLRRRADALGAGVSFDSGSRTSVLSATCLKDDLAALLVLIRDVLANPQFDRKELRRWGQSQRIDWDSSLKDPEYRASQAIAQMLYAEGDPRRQEYEKPDSVETDSKRLAQARDVLIRLPGRIVAFAGDLTRAEAERAAEDLLPAAESKVPEDLSPRFRPITNAEERAREIVIKIPRLTQVYFSLVRDMVPLDGEDYPEYVVANHVLGGHFYSRLYRALRHEGGDTYGAGSGGPADPVPQDYELYTFTRDTNASEAETKLRETLRVFHENGITEAERADAASYLLGHLPFQRETPSQVLGTWLRERALGLEPGYLDETVDRAADQPLGEVNRFITKFHDPSKFTMVRVEPE